MRGTKAKQLRRYATQAIQHGVSMGLVGTHKAQVVSTPQRYLYQFLKGKNSNLVLKSSGG